MNEQVMIYEVKSAASSNAQELFSDDSKYFYCFHILNTKKFSQLFALIFPQLIIATPSYGICGENFNPLSDEKIYISEKKDTIDEKKFFSDVGFMITPNSRTEQTQLPGRNRRIVRRDPPMKKGLPSGSR